MADVNMEATYYMLTRAKALSQLASREVGPKKVTYLSFAMDKLQLGIAYILVNVFADLFPKAQVDRARAVLKDHEDLKDNWKVKDTINAVTSKLTNNVMPMPKKT
jgi:hypothetical protein